MRCRLVGDGARSRAQIRAICTATVTATSARSCRCCSGRHRWRCAAATRKEHHGGSCQSGMCDGCGGARLPSVRHVSEGDFSVSVHVCL